MVFRLFLLFGFSILLSCDPSMPEEVKIAYHNLPETIDFNFHVRPILSDRCFACHGPDEKARKADLRLDVKSSIFAKLEGKEMFPVVAGKPDQSELIKRILHENSEMVMPTPESKMSLTNFEKATLVKWVEQGAEWKKHWAFEAPIKPNLPTISNTEWAQNEIDYFVLDKLDYIGLQPSEEATKETLIRRLSFDLTGLPPTLEQVTDFKNDTSEKAYEALVDRLLSSKGYGERWAWEWLDVARYSDTNGYQGDFTRDAWPWRDWVIKAFNANMPYDQFSIKQLAGDLLPEATTDDILATAFNRNHVYNTEGGTIPEETRVTNVFDRTETTGTVWLGLTLNCVRCHDHKFDNISQKEYYQLYDYFNQTSEEGGGWGGKIKPLLTLAPQEDQREIKELDSYISSLYETVETLEFEKFPRAEGLPPSESKIAKSTNGLDPRILLKPPKLRGSGEYNQLSKYFLPTDSYGKTIQKLYETLNKYNEVTAKHIQVLVMDELDEPRTTFVLDRGGYQTPILTDTIRPDVPKLLPPLTDTSENNRLTLANWLFADEQPLTARVTVNRYWQAFFGNGIVKTAEDFGVQGALPTHPKLLDWLATDFQENGWNLKRLFKQIVMSATYRQSSKISKELLETDPENAYLARATRMRLPSWMLRDQALFVSNLLKDSIGGIPVKPYQPEGIWDEATFGFIKYKQDTGEKLYRRSLYTFWRRIVGPTFLFDNASRQVCTVRSLKTNTPLHALTTLNDITFTESSRVMAERILNHSLDDKKRIQFAFELVSSRSPSSDEINILHNRLASLRKTYSEDITAAKEITSIGEFRTNRDLDLADHAAYSVLSSLLLNLDETITRQ
ncbi:MAG: PSD1 and planctomycete cytochrome C domain-containing protein [Maribacter sp.]|uniref:PSD1 and planctomycete cytochrome C domain-containing protein n=1 Tax=Maribacter sp. TaxID=1897614 RepID=UPI0032992551